MKEALYGKIGLVVKLVWRNYNGVYTEGIVAYRVNYRQIKILGILYV